MATLNRVDGSFEVPDTLPVIALRDLVYFPYMALPLLIGRAPSVAALGESQADSSFMLLVAQKDAAVDEPGQGDLHRAGTVVRVLQVSRLADGTVRAVMEGLGRARIARFLPSGMGFRASVELLTEWEFEPDPRPDPGLESLVGTVDTSFREYVQLSDKIPNEVIASAAEIADRVRLGPPDRGSSAGRNRGEAGAARGHGHRGPLRDPAGAARARNRDPAHPGEARRADPLPDGRRRAPGPPGRAVRQARPGVRRCRSGMGRTGEGHHTYSPARRGRGPGRARVRAAPQAQLRHPGGVRDPDLPGLDPGPPLGAGDAGQPGHRPCRHGAGGRALRAGGGQGADPGPHCGAFAGGAAAGADPVPGGPAGGGKDIAGPEHRALPSARVRAGQPRRCA